jgi:hypothetical protein
MNGIDLWDLRLRFEQSNILICFNGPLSQSIIEQLGIAIKRYLQEDHDNQQLSDEKLYDVFAVYIELTQNIRNYSQASAQRGAAPNRFDSATVAIGKLGSHYLVTAGNPIDQADLPALTSQIDALSQLDREQLKEHYKERRRRARVLDQPSAGLGLIDMARKAACPLEYKVREIDERTAFFHLVAVI